MIRLRPTAAVLGRLAALGAQAGSPRCAQPLPRLRTISMASSIDCS